jgi:hypothetical protein
MKQETAESETGVAEKSRWDQANSRQKPGLVWRNRKKISQITKDYFYLPFFLLIILWGTLTMISVNSVLSSGERGYPRPVIVNIGSLD